MTLPAIIVDVLVVVIALLALRAGYKQGALASVLAAVGIMAGVIVSFGLAPLVMSLSDTVVVRFFLGLALITILVGCGNLLGTSLGVALRDRMKVRSSQALDSLLGAFFQFVAVLMVLWLVSVPLATGLGKPVSTGIGGSTILRGVHRLTPDSWNRLPAQIAALLDESGLPPLVSPWDTPRTAGVVAPNPNLANPELITELRPSIIHVMGSSKECSRRLLGSGFVIDEDYVITNAHVVAGTDTVRLDTVLGVKEAEVVYFNPGIDVAVLHSAELGIDPLSWADAPAHSGDDAIVAGYPESGPFEAAPARVADVITISGSDIYAEGRLQREAYSVRSTIRSGNSGGPLLNDRGEVLGVVFGASRDNTDLGFALTAAEVKSNIGEVKNLKSRVGTDRCV